MGIHLKSDYSINDKCRFAVDLQEMPYNDVYIEDHKVHFRNYDMDLPARDLIRQIYRDNNKQMPDMFWTDDGEFDDMMQEKLNYSPSTFDGMAALLYSMMVSKAEFREVLMRLADTMFSTTTLE